MAESIIKKVTNDSGNGYCKMLDGTLIQWGILTIGSISAGNTGSASTSYPIPFIDTPSVSATASSGAPNVRLASAVTTRTGITVYCYSSTSVNAMQIYWQAIGRWK